MNSKRLLVAAAVMILVIAGIVALTTNHSSRTVRAEEIQSGASPAPSRHAQRSYPALISQRKLDPKFVEPLGSRAFAISRSGAFRPSGDAKEFILSRLEASDSGDSTATFEIYLAALDCRNAGSPSEIQSAALLAGVSDQQSALDNSERRLQECSSLLKDSTLSPAGKWLLKAAQQGSIEAMLLYAIDTESAFGGSSSAIQAPEAVVEWKRNAASFLNAAANQGSVDALVALGSANTNGIIVEKNPTEAYAYYLAAKRAMPSAFSEKLLGMYKKELSSAQQQAAIRRADAIYGSCCQ